MAHIEQVLALTDDLLDQATGGHEAKLVATIVRGVGLWIGKEAPGSVAWVWSRRGYKPITYWSLPVVRSRR